MIAKKLGFRFATLVAASLVSIAAAMPMAWSEPGRSASPHAAPHGNSIDGNSIDGNSIDGNSIDGNSIDGNSIDGGTGS